MGAAQKAFAGLLLSLNQTSYNGGDQVRGPKCPYRTVADSQRRDDKRALSPIVGPLA